MIEPFRRSMSGGIGALLLINLVLPWAYLLGVRPFISFEAQFYASLALNFAIFLSNIVCARIYRAIQIAFCVFAVLNVILFIFAGEFSPFTFIFLLF